MLASISALPREAKDKHKHTYLTKSQGSIHEETLQHPLANYGDRQLKMGLYLKIQNNELFNK